MDKRLVIALFLAVFVVLGFAHGDEPDELGENNASHAKYLPIDPIHFVYFAGGIAIAVLLVALVLNKHFNETCKKVSFVIVSIAVGGATLYLAGSTVYLNIISETGGPVHWHADYQVWACGERLDLVNPQFPSNKIGSPLFHEHDDDRIHIEGTVLKYSSINLGSYFRIIDGELENGHLIYPSVDGVVNLGSGESCPQEGPGALKVYVNGKLTDEHENYLIYPAAYVPPGDCIIVVFDDSDDVTTDLLCESWAVNDWDYESFERRPVVIGDKSWQ